MTIMSQNKTQEQLIQDVLNRLYGPEGVYVDIIATMERYVENVREILTGINAAKDMIRNATKKIEIDKGKALVAAFNAEKNALSQIRYAQTLMLKIEGKLKNDLAVLRYGEG